MFTKTKETETPFPSSTPSTPTPPQYQQQPVSVPAPQPKRGARTGVPSIISAELTVKGTLVSAGDVQIDGKVEGDIRSAGLVIGEKATVLGDLYAEEVAVRGRVEGSVRARKVQLCSTCHVEGNILHEALSIETGAFFEGNCRHSDNPLAEAPELAMERRVIPERGRSSSAHASSLKNPQDVAAVAARSAAASVAPLKD